jgi:aspartate racemase
VLGAGGDLVPHGVTGEIHIGGRGVACGYFRRHELTQQHFLSRLPDGTPGPWYRTGDQGRWRPDGVLEFAGRMDRQVKIRGVRVELPEIEAVLLDHAAVQAAAVVCLDDATGLKSLRAVCVTRPGMAASAAGLRAHLQARLPVALIPREVLLVSSLPTTPSGKIDRQVLATLPASAEPEVGYCAARTPLEMRLVTIWEQFLPQRPIGVRDDFFALGGHSLLAATMAAAIERACGQRLPPALLFESPNIEQLARRMTADRGGAERSLSSMLATGPTPPLWLIHQLAGDLTRYDRLVRLLLGRRAIYGVQAVGLTDFSPPLRSIESMANRYLEELRAVQPQGPYALAGHSAGGLIAYEMAQRLHEQGEQVALLVMIDADARMRRRVGKLDKLRYLLHALASQPPRVWLNESRALAGALPQSTAAPSAAVDPVRLAIEQAVDSYVPRPYPGMVTVLRARLRSAHSFSRTLSWQPLALGGVRVIDVPGGHLSMLQTGAVETVAQCLGDCLEALFPAALQGQQPSGSHK